MTGYDKKAYTARALRWNLLRFVDLEVGRAVSSGGSCTGLQVTYVGTSYFCTLRKTAAQCNPGLHLMPADSSWVSSSLGQTVLTEENLLLSTAVRRMHGDTLLWAGVSAGTAGLSRRSMVRQRIFVAPRGVGEGELTRADVDDMSPLSCDLGELPLRNNCIDALLLHHTLELASDPRAALREAARVLKPGGQMVICAFNKLGLFSCFRALESLPSDYVNPIQLRDWLDVLGFESVVATQHRLFRPPFGLEQFDAPRWDKPRGILRRMALPVGNLVVVHVRKKSLSIHPDWQAAPRRRVALAGAAYPKLVDTRRKVP